MKLKKNQKYSDKHAADSTVDEQLADAVRSRAKDKELACAVAFDIAAALGCSPSEIGRTTDLLDFRLAKCQLGLFGYRPRKKIVKPSNPSRPEIETAIRAEAADGLLSCSGAWELAKRFGVAKMDVSAACEAMGIKIKPCQLGAF